ncbi:hypothetical protein VCHC42A1_2597, partial [Vibrio cholerae HC-42A1]
MLQRPEQQLPLGPQ